MSIFSNINRCIICATPLIEYINGHKECDYNMLDHAFSIAKLDVIIDKPPNRMVIRPNELDINKLTLECCYVQHLMINKVATFNVDFTNITSDFLIKLFDFYSLKIRKMIVIA